MKYLMILALFVPLVLTAPSKAVQQDHKSTIELMKDFINLTQKTSQSFEYWIEQLGYHLAHKETFETFEKQLRSGLTANKPQIVLKAFNDHKHLFGQAAQMELLKVGIPKLQKAFKERLALHQRLCALNKAEKEQETHRQRLLGILTKVLGKLVNNPQPDEQFEGQKRRYQWLNLWIKEHQQIFQETV